MANPGTPRWKQLFDAADRTLGARLNDFVRSENFAILAGLATEHGTTSPRVLNGYPVNGSMS